MSWNKIDNLLKKTEAFYKKALWEGFVTKAQGKLVKSAETHDEKAKRLEKEKAAKRKLIEEQTKEFLRQEKLKRKQNQDLAPESTEDLAPESVEQAPISEDGLEQDLEEAVPESYEYGEDLGMYADILDVANNTNRSMPEVADELYLLAELYKNTIKTNGGYAYMANFINNEIERALPMHYGEFQNESDEGITFGQKQKKQADAIESFLNGVYADIKARATKGGKDINAKDSVQELLSIKEVKQKFQEELKKQETSTEGLTPEQVEDLERGGVEEEEKADPYQGSLDKGDLAGKRAPEGEAKPGMSVWQPYEAKEWAASYKGDMERLKDQLTKLKDPFEIQNTKELIEVIGQLHQATVAKEAMQSDASVAWTVNPRIMSPDGKTVISPRTKTIDDPGQRAQWEALIEQQNKLRQRKAAISAKLRVKRTREENETLKSKIKTAGPKEKFLLEQEMALNALVASNDRNKRRELKLRRQLVETLGGSIDPTDDMYKNRQDPEQYLPDVSKEHIDLMMNKIAEAAALKISSYEANVEQANKIKKEFNYYGEMRGDPISVEGIFIQFTQSIPSIKMGIKKKITAEFRESKNTTYDSYRQAISTALQAGDAAAVTLAEKAFQKKLNNDAEQHPAIISFVEYSQGFTKYLEQLKILHKEESKTEENGKVLLSATSIDLVNQLYEEGKKLHALEMIRNPGFGRKGPSNAAKALEIIIKQLGERVASHKEVRVSPDAGGSRIAPEAGINARIAPQDDQFEELTDDVIDQPELKQQVVKGFYQMSLKQKLAALQDLLRKEELLKFAQENDLNFYAETPEQLGGELPQTQMSKADADAQADKIMDNIIDNLKIKGLDY